MEKRPQDKKWIVPAAQEPPELPVPVRSADDIMREQMTEFVEAIAKEEPENLAKLVKLWIED